MDYIEDISTNPFAYEEAMYHSLDAYVKKVISKYFPFETKDYKTIRNQLMNASHGGILNGKSINDIHKAAVMYFLSNHQESAFNPNAIVEYEENGKIVEMTNSEFYNEKFPYMLLNLMKNNPDIRNLELFENLTVEITKDEISNKEKAQIIFKDLTSLSIEAKDDIKYQWAELLENEDLKELGELLYFYGYHASGFDYNHKSILSLAPIEAKLNIPASMNYEGEEITYAETLRKMFDSIGDSDNFSRVFIANNIDNYQFKARLSEEDESLFKSKMIVDG